MKERFYLEERTAAGLALPFERAGCFALRTLKKSHPKLSGDRLQILAILLPFSVLFPKPSWHLCMAGAVLKIQNVNIFFSS
jgi:hypothetical protein